MSHILKVVLALFLILTCVSSSPAPAGGEHPWSVRGNFSILFPDNDRIKNLFGGSIEVLHRAGNGFRFGGELGLLTGDGETAGISVDLDWLQALVIGEYVIGGFRGDGFEPYLGLGVGIGRADARARVSGVTVRGDDTSIAVKPFVGADIFFTGNLGLNLTGGYLFSESDVAGVESDFSGFEGSAGITYRF